MTDNGGLFEAGSTAKMLPSPTTMEDGAPRRSGQSDDANKEQHPPCRGRRGGGWLNNVLITCNGGMIMAVHRHDISDPGQQDRRVCTSPGVVLFLGRVPPEAVYRLSRLTNRTTDPHHVPVAPVVLPSGVPAAISMWRKTCAAAVTGLLSGVVRDLNASVDLICRNRALRLDCHGLRGKLTTYRHRRGTTSMYPKPARRVALGPQHSAPLPPRL